MPRPAYVIGLSDERMFLLWVRTFDGRLIPQIVFGDDGARPDLDAATRRAVVSWTPLAPAEAGLPLDEIARRHPPRMGRMLAGEY